MTSILYPPSDDFGLSHPPVYFSSLIERNATIVEGTHTKALCDTLREEEENKLDT